MTNTIKKSDSSRKWIALICLSLFLSLFAFENFHHVLNQEIQVEVIDFENTDGEKDSKKGDKETDDKLTSKMGLSQLAIQSKSAYQLHLEEKKNTTIREVVSPPPEL